MLQASSNAGTNHASAEMRFPLDSTEAILLALPRPVAVVGNGAPARQFGKLIDRYASVLRLNNYVIDGFAESVGHRTTLRVTSAWSDIEPRNGGVDEVSPFALHRPESAAHHLYCQKSGGTVATPVTDVADLLPGVSKPSTGLALLALCAHLGIEIDAFGFDGFRTGHYWDGRLDRSVHGDGELECLLGLKGITLYGASYDYASLYDYCHTHHGGYNINEGLRLYSTLGLRLSGERILEFGAGNGALSARLEKDGNQVISMEVSEVAFERIPVAAKIRGDCLDLATLSTQIERPLDRFVSIDVLEHLTENDIRIVLRHAARACRGILVSASTRPSGLLGPRGENLHLTVRSVQWWLETLEHDFVVTGVIPGIETGQVLFEGYSRMHVEPKDLCGMGDHRLPYPPAMPNLGLPQNYVARPKPEYYVDSVANNAHMTWQPDVYPLAAHLGRKLGCRTLVDVGCGHARKLAKLSGEFDIIGIDYGPNIEYCRNTYSFGVWLEADFETPLPLPLPKSVLDGSIVICSDVIEHMVDPMALLALLKELLTHAAAVVLSTPDRARTYGQSHFGPSPNRAHTREWTAEELGRLLKHAGFEVASLTHTRSNDVQPELATVLAVLVNRAHVGVQATMTPVPADVPEAPDGSERISAGPIVGRRGPAIDAGVNGLDEARQAVERAPESPDAWLALAIAQESHGCAEGFEQALGEALRLDRGHVPSLRYLATLQLRQGDPREAAWMFDELLDDGAVDVDIVEGSVLAHWRSGDVKAAAARLLMHG